MVVDFKSLLNKYTNIHPGAMGFPTNWEKEQLWQ